MINHVYEVKCDHCGMADYVHGIQNKKELKAELIARGYVVWGDLKQLFCNDECAADWAIA